MHLAFQHSNLGYRVGPLGLLIGVAEAHRWHHKREHEDAQVNYGDFWMPGATCSALSGRKSTRWAPKSDTQERWTFQWTTARSLSILPEPASSGKRLRCWLYDLAHVAFLRESGLAASCEAIASCVACP